MSTDLDELLRETLRARAATITDGPRLSTPEPSLARRPGWLALAAAVAVIVAVAAGVSALHDIGDTPQHAGDAGVNACRATLPKAWADAFHADPVRVDGSAATPIGFSGPDTVVEWFPEDGSNHFGVTDRNGVTTERYSVPKNRLGYPTIDGRWLAVQIGVVHSTASAQSERVTDIALVNLHTGSVRHLLTPTLSARYAVTGKAAVLLDGQVYWQSARRAGHGNRRDVVLRHTIATGKVVVVAHGATLLTGPDDPRGVFWTGGGVARAGVPSETPTVSANPYTPVVGDGTDFAWTDLAGDQQTIGWADTAGGERSFHVDPTNDSRIRSDPIAVSGPFVFLAPQGYGDPHVYVLDTRTGAFADSGIQSEGGGVATPTTVSIGTRVNDHSDFTAVVLDTARVPALHC